MKKSTTPAQDDKKNQDEQLEDLNYPPSQDIMSHDKRLDVDPENLPGGQAPYSTHKAHPVNKENRQQQPEDIDLDVPGADLDDADEILGEEDEENNYYSLSDNNDEQDSDGSGVAFEGTEEKE